MAAIRGRTITTFGQAFTPLGLSGGITAAAPVVRKIIEALIVNLPARLLSAYLPSRLLAVTLPIRKVTVKMRID